MVPSATWAVVATSRIWTASYPPSDASRRAASRTRVRRASWLRVNVRRGGTCAGGAAVACGCATVASSDASARDGRPDAGKDIARLHNDALDQFPARRQVLDQADHLTAGHDADVAAAVDQRQLDEHRRIGSHDHLAPVQLLGPLHGET